MACVSAPGGPLPLSCLTLLNIPCSSFPIETATADRAGERIPVVAVGAVCVVVEFGQALRRLATGTVGPFAIGLRDTRMRGKEISRLDHAEAGGRVGDLAALAMSGTRRQNGCASQGPDRPSIARDTATVPRSRPARAGPRRRDTSWPTLPAYQLAHDLWLEPTAREKRRLHGHRFELPLRISAASTKIVMPSVHAGSPLPADATATVRPASADANSASRCGPSSSTVVEPVSTAPRSLTKYLFHRSVRTPTRRQRTGRQPDRFRRPGRRSSPAPGAGSAASMRWSWRAAARPSSSTTSAEPCTATGRRIGRRQGRRRDHRAGGIGRCLVRLRRQPRGRCSDRRDRDRELRTARRGGEQCGHLQQHRVRRADARRLAAHAGVHLDGGFYLASRRSG